MDENKHGSECECNSSQNENTNTSECECNSSQNENIGTSECECDSSQNENTGTSECECASSQNENIGTSECECNSSQNENIGTSECECDSSENKNTGSSESKYKSEAESYGGKPTTLKGKLENFWYHYKWHTIVSVFVLAVVIVIIAQALSAPRYDINIIYAGGYRFSRTTEDGDTVPYVTALESLGQVTDDFDGNGEVMVNLMDYYVLTSEEIAKMEEAGLGDDINHQRIMEDYKSLGQAMMTGDCCVLLFSEAMFDDFYDRYEGGALFCDLTSYIPNDKISNYSFYGDEHKAVYLSSLKLGSLPELENLPADTVLALRCPNDSSFGIGNGEKVFKNSEAIIKKIFELD